MNRLLYLLTLLILGTGLFAQEPSIPAGNQIPDVIITTTGNLFQCRIVEVNDLQVKYRLEKDTAMKMLSIPREEVYAISYGNGIAMIITPELLSKAEYDAKVMQMANRKADSILRGNMDVVVKTNGNLFHCRIMEVNDSTVIYRFPEMDTTWQTHRLPRDEVYAIAYGNSMARIITPELMGKEAAIHSVPNKCEGWETFKKNLGSGSLNVGIGFVDFYSPFKDSKSFDDTKTMPSVFAGYTFRIKDKIKAGVHVGVSGNELSKSGVSEYDQLKVSLKVDEQFLCVGLYGRYDIVDGMFKPYVKAGVDFIGVFMTTTSEAQSLDGSTASLKTVVQQRSIKPGLILRGGLEVMFGDMFGIYGDVGTGLSLVQAGVLFNLE